MALTVRLDGSAYIDRLLFGYPLPAEHIKEKVACVSDRRAGEAVLQFIINGRLTLDRNKVLSNTGFSKLHISTCFALFHFSIIVHLTEKFDFRILKAYF